MRRVRSSVKHGKGPGRRQLGVRSVSQGHGIRPVSVDVDEPCSDSLVYIYLYNALMISCKLTVTYKRFETLETVIIKI